MFILYYLYSNIKSKIPVGEDGRRTDKGTESEDNRMEKLL